MNFKKKNILSTLIGLILLILIILIAQPSSQDELVKILGLEEEIYTSIDETKNSTDKFETIKIERVVDGDTAELEDGRRVRYLNIDTPESVKPNTPVQCYAKEASRMNKALVEGKNVILMIDETPIDRYGRDLRFIFLEGKNTNDITQSVNAYLVRMGYARASIYADNDTYKDAFLKMEREAKEKNLGLWAACENPFEE